jgi:hypothetical protein
VKKHQAASHRYFYDMHAIDKYRDLDLALSGLLLDPIDLVVVAIDQRDPRALALRVAPLCLLKHLRDHDRRVVGDARRQPLVLGLGPFAGGLTLLTCGGQDVGRRTLDGGDLVHGADLRHPFAATLLALRQPGLELLLGVLGLLAGLLALLEQLTAGREELPEDVRERLLDGIRSDGVRLRERTAGLRLTNLPLDKRLGPRVCPPTRPSAVRQSLADGCASVLSKPIGPMTRKPIDASILGKGRRSAWRASRRNAWLFLSLSPVTGRCAGQSAPVSWRSPRRQPGRSLLGCCLVASPLATIVTGPRRPLPKGTSKASQPLVVLSGSEALQ